MRSGKKMFVYIGRYLAGKKELQVGTYIPEYRVNEFAHRSTRRDIWDQWNTCTLTVRIK